MPSFSFWRVCLATVDIESRPQAGRKPALNIAEHRGVVRLFPSGSLCRTGVSSGTMDFNKASSGRPRMLDRKQTSRDNERSDQERSYHDPDPGRLHEGRWCFEDAPYQPANAGTLEEARTASHHPRRRTIDSVSPFRHRADVGENDRSGRLGEGRGDMATKQPPKTRREDEFSDPKRVLMLKQLSADAPSKLGVFKSVYSLTASPRQAIKAKCLECCWMHVAGIRECLGTACPLWSFRPYQQKGGGDE